VCIKIPKELSDPGTYLSWIYLWIDQVVTGTKMEYS
jgi:hypothetical protein